MPRLFAVAMLTPMKSWIAHPGWPSGEAQTEIASGMSEALD